ncbi:MAG: C25 family cysteine peptidase, partial [Anaerolineae bacterium]
MTEAMDLERSFSLPKGEAFKAGSLAHMEVEGDYTSLEFGELADQYKLSDAYKNVRNLEYRSDKTLELQTFAEYREVRAPEVRAPFEVELKRRPSYPRDEAYRNRKLRHLYTQGDMLVLVDKTVYQAVAGSINRYVLDVGRDGYWATVHVVQGGTPADIRSYISRRSPVGVLLVGAIAAPWFEMDDDFHDAHSEFPCDLYYMDTNGTWTDPDGDGKFSGHNGDLMPEIWVGRLYTPTAGGNDAALINDYFARNHQYRMGKLGHARSGLAFVDDDWQNFGDCALDLQFPASALTVYTAPDVTDADLYKAEVNSLRAWVQLCTHSWPQGHAFSVS